MSIRTKPAALGPKAEIDWRRVTELVQTSRALDAIEEQQLSPSKIFYQFSARGHDLAQVLLGLLLTHPKDVICGYYRSRPVLLALGVDIEDALGSAMGRAGGYSDGRDIGVVFNHPNDKGPSALPMCGGVGAQYTPTAGYAQAIEYRRNVLNDPAYEGAIAVALGGDASVATNGFWAALTMAATLKLPMLFFIEDNGYGISVPSSFQTPGANIAANLASFGGLKVIDGDGAEPVTASELIGQAVAHVRAGEGPCLLRLTVPRLCGHSHQDEKQIYKTPAIIAAEQKRDPLPRLKAHLAPAMLSETDWNSIAADAQRRVEQASAKAQKRPVSKPSEVTRFVFSEGEDQIQRQGGQWQEGYRPPASSDTPKPKGGRIPMAIAIRMTLDHELSINDRMVVFGEDVGPKGGVHGVTADLQKTHGETRVFDTSLSEEGIIGRAVGMALAGLAPVAEIQFRKYADSAVEQINDCGTMRWRTANRFAAPIVVRMPIGFGKCGDPWHSQTNEVQFVHSPGWQVVIPANAEEAVGLLRTAMRGNDPVMFLEHRNLLMNPSAAYPGDDFTLPFGKARDVALGCDITIVAWGAMVERCVKAAQGASAHILDLRTLSPWDRDSVIASVKRTRRCLIVHEDLGTGGFGAEIAAVLAQECFLDLDAPITRLTMPDIPSPHHPELMEWALPSVARIREKIELLVGF